MATIALLNPRPRKGSAAAKRMMAAIRQGKSPKRHLALVKSKAPAKKRRTRARAAVAKARRTYRSAPKSLRLSISSIGGMAKGAAIGAAGAVAVDVSYNYIKQHLPVSMQTPQDLSTGALNPMYYLAKAAAALALGLVGSKVTKYAVPMAEGALLVNGYEVLKGLVPANIGLGAYVPRMPSNVTPLSSPPRQINRGMGQYVPASIREAMRDR